MRHRSVIAAPCAMVLVCRSAYANGEQFGAAVEGLFILLASLLGVGVLVALSAWLLGRWSPAGDVHHSHQAKRGIGYAMGAQSHGERDL
jgi:hypothetical protein